ncbi:hypothetical protein P7H00_13990 [Enterococcus pseudoavium]|uniref:Uncharacterized protein n=1 Tax=Enterococcus pseudoavium TaxID=44007 RepID=A0AAE4I2Z0_9ENTE|nr:hypothetical protein [Enterococcus pseudoavium]MDT2738216.1 hypothetical protein [Enterococcus pseudoavium]
MIINEIWESNDEKIWNAALKKATFDTGRDNYIESKLSRLNVEYIKNLSKQEFYTFLHDDYFVWKFTAKNRLKTSRTHLENYDIQNKMEDLEEIQKEIFSFNLSDTPMGLTIVTKIKGLGVAGGSGLLSLLFPSFFGTVDEQAIKALLATEQYKDDPILNKIKTQDIKIKEGVYLNNIYQKKSHELNQLFGSYCWTPRDIDVILWFYRDKNFNQLTFGSFPEPDSFFLGL